jgi:hypothetical protein
MLLESRDDEGNALSREQIHDEVITLLLAGHETTANGLAWTWVLLMANPWAMDLLQAETRDVLDGGRRLPEARDLAVLRYTRMVFEESLRMYPPAWILGRRALADDVIGGQAIPAGTVVAISPYLLHRHPAFWVDPERFDPERFSPDRSASRKPFSCVSDTPWPWSKPSSRSPRSRRGTGSKRHQATSWNPSACSSCGRAAAFLRSCGEPDRASSTWPPDGAPRTSRTSRAVGRS